MKPGDCFTIEPCITQGAEDAGCWTFPDEWTASTEVRRFLGRFNARSIPS
jgi:hypothetical protein